MATLYRNFLAGVVDDNPLSSGATTLTSSALADLPTVASPDIMWLALDPDASAGAPELVKVTAHTAAATTATIVRAQQSTTARQHLQNVPWRVVFTRTDAESIVTPAGTIRATMNTSADDGWLLFNQTVVGADALYPALWAVAPAAWKSGSDLVLPDLADSVLMGVGTTAIGAAGGANSRTIASANLPVHTHTIDHNHASATTSSDGAHTHTEYVGTTTGGGVTSPNTTQTTTPSASNVSTSSDGAHTHTLDLPNYTGSSGDGGFANTALDTTPAHLAVTYQIKAH